MFAHVFNASYHSAYLIKNEIQCSPYVINGSDIDGEISLIHICIYSNNPKMDGEFIVFSKEKLIKYVEEKYKLLDLIIKELQNIAEAYENKILIDTVEVDKNPLITLESLKVVAENRYDYDVLDQIANTIYTYKYKTTNSLVNKRLKKYKNYITLLVNEFAELYQNCDAKLIRHGFLNAFKKSYKESPYFLILRDKND